MHVPAATAPTRTALLLRAVIVAAVGGALRLLVSNESDNAYIVLWTAGTLLVPLAVPFLVAALLPAGRERRGAARVAVALVWMVGGLFAALFLFYTVLIAGTIAFTPVIQGAGPGDWGVIVAHVLGAMLTVPLVLRVNHRLFPPAGARLG